MSEATSYRHERHDDIEALLRHGWPNKAIADELGVDHRAVARVRRIIGLKPFSNATTEADKLARFSVPQANGHTLWTGRRSTSGGTPVIRQGSREIPAAAVAFEKRTGRKPVGTCRADCDQRHCLTPDHVTDDLERRKVRLLLRAVYGWTEPWDVCPSGHGWDEHGRVEPDLTLYCLACNTDRARRSRANRKDGS